MLSAVQHGLDKLVSAKNGREGREKEGRGMVTVTSAAARTAVTAVDTAAAAAVAAGERQAVVPSPGCALLTCLHCCA